ncbi:hypothetical protein Sango_2479800 [Sesamum angolense]|uniref:Reverse transcriptase zinc-binding domain-containing protein n=1 Tax=Sesamum angolense TaxID=2727404 RepID=A0AAE1W3K6_9LAMI|nr:hypothetical protein Sango_2479800 [Sesamum angolense]
MPLETRNPPSSPHTPSALDKAYDDQASRHNHRSPYPRYNIQFESYGASLKRILFDDSCELHQVGSGDSISLWHDPWLLLGPLILAFPRSPQLTQTAPHDLLNVVIENGSWRWPLINDIACLEITRLIPPIHHGNDSITWNTHGGAFDTKAAYDLFQPSGPKVGWSSLFVGPFKIPRKSFILWLAILERLSTLDKPWLSHIDGTCILCNSGIRRHTTIFSLHVLMLDIALPPSELTFPWPYMEWQRGVTWATAR